MFRNPLTDGIVILVIVLLILGPKRLPELGKGLGRGMREFKDGIAGDSKDDADTPTLNSAPPAPPQPSQTPTEGAQAPVQNPAPPQETQGRESAEVGSEQNS